MTAAFIGAGSFVSVIGANQPVAPAFSAGQQVIVFTGEFLGADTIAAPGAPWVELSANSGAPGLRAFGLNSATGAEAMPSFTWSGTNRGWAVATIWSGLDTGFAAGFTADDRLSNQKQNIVGPGNAHTPTVDGCIVVLFGTRNKTSVSNGTSYSKPTGWTSLIAQIAAAGTQPSVAISYLLQGTATIVAANQSMNGSIAETTTQSLDSSLFAIKPAVIAPSSTPTLGLLGVGS